MVCREISKARWAAFCAVHGAIISTCDPALAVISRRVTRGYGIGRRAIVAPAARRAVGLGLMGALPLRTAGSRAAWAA